MGNWDKEIKRVAEIFAYDFYKGIEESEKICKINNWNEKKFSIEVSWYFEDLCNM